MGKTLDHGTGRACGCQGKTLGEVFAREEERRADLLRKADAMRHEQELTALIVRLEVAEDQAENLLAENRRLQSLVNENPQLEEMRRLKEENYRLTGALAEEQKQRGEIDRAIGGTCQNARRTISELLVAIGELREQAENPDDQPSLNIVVREKPEDLPAGYAFKVAAYVLDRAAELEE